MEEMTRRAMESKASGVVYGSSGLGDGEKGVEALESPEKRKFEGAHKRAFDKWVLLKAAFQSFRLS